MIDLHCHLLPGVDDGPATIEESLALARAAVAEGTTAIVATPHLDHGFGLSAAELAPATKRVRESLREAGIVLEVHSGAEVALDRYLDLDDEQRDAARLGDGPYLLLEAPLTQSAGEFDLLLGSLLRQGVPMVIAHPERCPAFQRQPERLARLVAEGALGQVTAASLAGRFGELVRRTAVDQVRNGLVHDIASDAHHAERRGPGLREGIEALVRELPGSAALVDWMTVDLPQAVLSGASLPARPTLALPPPRRRGLRSRVFGR